MQRPKLIILNGPSGIGKSTITRKYLNKHPLALGIDGDELIIMLGQWRQHEPTARRMVAAFTLQLARLHLTTGHDVVIPYLALNLEDLQRFEALAQACDADFYEILLHTSREEAVRRMFSRGHWGERGQPPLAEADRPIIEELYERMTAVAGQRPGVTIIPSIEGDIDETYRQFENTLSSPPNRAVKEP